MIKLLKSFKLNKEELPFSVTRKLVKFIQNFTLKNTVFTLLLKEVNKNTNIPIKVLQQKSNQILFRRFDFKLNKFKNFNLNLIFFDAFKFFSISLVNLLGHFFLTFHKVKKKEFDLLCDNVFNQVDVERYSLLIKSFKKVCLLGSISPKKKIKNEKYFKYNIMLIGISNSLIKEKTFFIIFGFKILYYSVKYNVNLYSIFLDLIYDIYKSKYIFSNIKSKYFITQKFYSTSPIFNYYFKKNGGKLTSCTQKNICASSLSPFVFTDVMFTLGKGQGKICNKLGGKVKKFVPVGSLFMENVWFKKKKDLKKVPKTDVLILGINTLFNNRHYVNNFYKEDYYGSYLKWLKKLSIEFPEKKFVLKHHGDYTNDPEERKILKDSNIKVLIKNESINSSYAYAFKSKIVISFASTMIIEILGHGKMAYFIDPGLRGDQWYRDIKKINKFRIGNYNKLRSLITQKTKISFGSKKLSEYFCLESQNTSKLISNYFKKNKI